MGTIAKQIGLRALGLLAMVLLGSGSLGAAETRRVGEEGKLWAAVLVGALAKDEPKPTNEELQEFQNQLHSIFGYDSFRIAGEFTEPLSKETFEVKTKNFSMQLNHLRSKEVRKGEPLVHDFSVKLFQKGKQIVQAKVEATTGTPFYVRGPVWGNKEIILMILVR